ncbi:MAG: hybrid sensor histidine kinase/response regulator [Bdellovibrio sp.]|nr:MAG: hybrid sensor histidine kinase/response regulator [Bdellovibrio sp.]
MIQKFLSYIPRLKVFKGNHQKIREALQSANERFQILVENSPSVMYTLRDIGNNQFKLTYISDNVKTLYGFSPDDFYNNENFWAQHIHPEDRPQVYSKVPELLEKGSYSFAYRFLCKNGEYKWIRDDLRVMEPSQQKPYRELIGLCVDVSNLKSEENKLRQAFKAASQALNMETAQKNYAQSMKDRMTAILEATTDYVFMFSLDGKILYLNKACKDLQGLQDNEPLQALDHLSFYPRWAQEVVKQKVIPETIKKGSFKTRLVLKGRNKKHIPTSQVFLAHKGPHGEVEFFSTIARDITESIKNEKTLIKLKEKADAANKAKSHFLANMSHEIRTPLGVVLGYAEILANTHISEEQRKEYLRIIYRNGHNLLNLIDDILDLSKVESGRLEFQKTSFKLKNFLEDLVCEFSAPIKEKGLEFKLQFKENVPPVIQSDPLRLRQILTNLINNSLKFTNKGFIKLSVKYERKNQKKKLVFEVEDTGCGINPFSIDMLFKPFSQSDISINRKYGGTGLGLSLSRYLARGLGGDVKLKRTTIGMGCVFEVSIDPGTKDSLHVIKEMKAPSSSPEPYLHYDKKQVLRNLHILVVEDFEDNQVLMKTILEKAGAQVDLASNGEEGLQKINSDKSYDVVFMDIQMPKMNGYETIHFLRKENYTKPIIALTAYAMAGEKEKCLNLGFSDYISKPITPSSLIQKTLEIVSRYKKAPADNNIRLLLPAPQHSTSDSSCLFSQFKDDPVISKILEKFVSNLPFRYEKLKSAIQNKNREEIKRLAHQLKGACSSYGYPSLAELAWQIENTSEKEEDLSFLEKPLEEFQKLIPKVQRAIRTSKTDRLFS